MGEEIKNNKTCFIFGGNIDEFDKSIISQITENDFIICADKGYEISKKYNIKPNLIVGDFDSYKGEIDKKIPTITLPIKKDDTDLLYAVKMGVKKGYINFVLSSVSGGRLDQTIASIQTLKYLLDNNLFGYIFDNNSKIYLVNDSLKITKPNYPSYFSIFSFENTAKGVSISGGAYNVDNITFYNNYPLGVSNEFLSDVEITVKNGTILVIVSKKYL